MICIRSARHALILILTIIGVCIHNQILATQPNHIVYLKNHLLKAEVDPSLFSVILINADGERFQVSSPSATEKFTNLKFTPQDVSWAYPDKKLSVHLVLYENYLSVGISASDSSEIIWPKTGSAVKAFTIPFAQGKYIPANDAVWIDYLTHDGPFSGSQDLSMQFFATSFEKQALLYIISNMYNNKIAFHANAGNLSLSLLHEFTKPAKNKNCSYRIYPIADNPVDFTKTYKKYVEQKEHILTLEEKAKVNPNIRKLYGAPFIYIWNTDAISAGDVKKWKQLKSQLLQDVSAQQINPFKHIFQLFKNKDAEYGREFLTQFNDFKNSEYVIKYHQFLLTKAFSEAILRKDFYNAEAWNKVPLDQNTKMLIAKGADNLSRGDLFRMNESLLFSAYPDFFLPYSDWGGASMGMLDDMYKSGITKAWLGFDDWQPGELHPDFAEKAKALGYLVAPYDSYHSIHPPGQEKWSTAKFEDTTLYTLATVLRKDGKPQSGFLGAGRQLNPVMSLPAVHQRVQSIMDNSDRIFNSWFIDCDGTGEIFDDYTPGRMTDQNEDLQARLKRMSWIKDKYNLVIGTEVGNDFAANTIAFGHGMTTPVIAWNDPDMRKNKSSPYFIGGYFSNNGGIPLRYSLQAPIKSKYDYIYFDNRFNLPLFQLVYNNAVITSHHWESGSLKYKEEIKSNELKDILYNLPPLYHLDSESWIKFKSVIAHHVKIFTKIHQEAVLLEMTSFECLTADRRVQRTMFGSALEIIANFGRDAYLWKNISIPAGSIWIHHLYSDSQEFYQP